MFYDYFDFQTIKDTQKLLTKEMLMDHAFFIATLHIKSGLGNPKTSEKPLKQ